MTPDLESANPYAVLGVAAGADLADIRRAFRALALRHHPDAQPADEKEKAARLFARVNQAHEILRDPEKRRRCDELLARGVAVELDRDLGSQGAPSLADIIGAVQSLGLGGDADEVTQSIPTALRENLLSTMLIAGPEFRETALDSLDLEFLPDGNGALAKLPQLERMFLGNCVEAVLVLTELRVMFLTAYKFIEASGGVQIIRTTYRGFAYPYEMVTTIGLRMEGRAFPRYLLDLTTQDGTAFRVRFMGRLKGESVFRDTFGPGRLLRLLLLAGRYGLKLDAARGGSASREVAKALRTSLIPIAVWAVPFVLVSPFILIDESFESWIDVATVFNRYGLTAAAALTAGLLGAVLNWRVARAWRGQRTE